MASQLRSVCSGALGMVFVGTSVSVSSRLVGAPLLTAQAIRYAVAFGLLLAMISMSGVVVPRPRGSDWLWLVGVAVSGLVVFNVAIVRGVAHAEPAVIAVAVACVPVLLAVIGPIAERRTPTPTAIIAAAVVTGGGVLVVGTGRTDASGIWWAALALACEAGFTLLAVPVLPRLGAMGVSLHAVWIAAAILAAFALPIEGPAAAAALTPGQWLAMLHLAVVVTAAAFVLWYSAVRALGAGTAGLLTGIAPISAAVAGIGLGAGIPALPVWLGMLVVLAGLSVGIWRDRIRPVDRNLEATSPLESTASGTA
ncbi:EamA family transporter [Jatrophihabitans sp. DSM 45814]